MYVWAALDKYKQCIWIARYFESGNTVCIDYHLLLM